MYESACVDKCQATRGKNGSMKHSEDQSKK